MAKNTNKPAVADTKTLTSMLDNPEFAQETKDMQKRSEDILGFWDENCSTPLFFTPRSAKLSDSKIEPEKKCSTLVEGLATRDCQVLSKDGEIIIAKPGDLIAVWAKPGMKALSNAAGVPVAMAYLGEKDTGKPNPMKLYDLRFGVGGQPLTVSADNRKLSKHTEPCIPVTFIGAPTAAPKASEPAASPVPIT